MMQSCNKLKHADERHVLRSAAWFNMIQHETDEYDLTWAGRGGAPHAPPRECGARAGTDAVWCARSGPREDATRIGSAGVVRRQAVDVSPLRRVNQAIWLLTTGARES